MGSQHGITDARRRAPSSEGVRSAASADPISRHLVYIYIGVAVFFLSGPLIGFWYDSSYGSFPVGTLAGLLISIITTVLFVRWYTNVFMEGLND